MDGPKEGRRDRSSFVSAAESLEIVKRERLRSGDRKSDQTHTGIKRCFPDKGCPHKILEMMSFEYEFVPLRLYDDQKNTNSKAEEGSMSKFTP